jgi:hypothetical protein
LYEIVENQKILRHFFQALKVGALNGCFFLVNGEGDRQPTMQQHVLKKTHHDKSFYLMRTKYKFLKLSGMSM